MSDDRKPGELLPCPFCGGTRLREDYAEELGRRIICGDCDAVGPDTGGHPCDATPATVWNTRVQGLSLELTVPVRYDPDPVLEAAVRALPPVLEAHRRALRESPSSAMDSVRQGALANAARDADLVLRHEAAWLRVLRDTGDGYGASVEHGEDPEQLADRALKLVREMCLEANSAGLLARRPGKP